MCDNSGMELLDSLSLGLIKSFKLLFVKNIKRNKKVSNFLNDFGVKKQRLSRSHQAQSQRLTLSPNSILLAHPKQLCSLCFWLPRQDGM